MSHDRLNSNDALGETSDGRLSASTSWNRRRKWNLNPVGGRRYNDLVDSKNRTEEIAQRLMGNLFTKRNIEPFDKNRNTEWLKTDEHDNTTGHESGEFSSDSGVSLCNSVDHENKHEKGWLKSDMIKKGNANKWSVDSEVFDVVIPPKVSNIERELINSRNGYEDLKDFYAPGSRWDDSGNYKVESRGKPSEEKLEANNFRKGTVSDRLSMKRSTRSADVIATTKKSWTSREKEASEGLTRTNRVFETDASITKTVMSGSSEKPNHTERNNYLTFKRTLETSLLRSERSSHCSTEPAAMTSQTSIENKTQQSSSTTNISNIAKSLIHLAQIKRSNKHAVANFLKNYSEYSEENVSSNTDNTCKKVEDSSLTQKDIGNSLTESLKLNFPNSNRKREEKLRPMSKTNMTNNDFSIKVNSDRQLVTSDSQLFRFQNEPISDTAGTTHTPITETMGKEICKSENEVPSYIARKHMTKTVEEKRVNCDARVPEMEIVSLANDMKLCSGDGTLEAGDNIREMNTQSALIYLSETLIESAQRAEMLLMQKMKEYNDLVCREMPEKKRQDFSCQVEMNPLRDQESEFETRSNQIRDNFLQELSDNKHKIQQLESDKKKLRQALKKIHCTTHKEKKLEAVTVAVVVPELNREEVDESINKDACCHALNTVTPAPVAVLKQRNENHQELVQALKIENNLLHTLLKEMKTELDQENATILNLAKKLELSLGKQTQVKVRYHQTEVVRQLEDKLEQQERMLKQEAMEARAVAKYVIIKYKKLIEEYKEKVKSHQETVDKLTNALK